MHRALHAVAHLIEDHAERTGIPVEFAAEKLIEGDMLIAEQMELDENEKEVLGHIVLQMEKERGLTRARPWRTCGSTILNGFATPA